MQLEEEEAKKQQQLRVPFSSYTPSYTPRGTSEGQRRGLIKRSVSVASDNERLPADHCNKPCNKPCNNP
jgi:hypothetical protein